ncbi:unnamed protein product [Cylicocyclus nassatus]|uniref:Uncharacterized protein n=1 Tax=Cylicocyclus nassatus TaxID=53992 RepID=A0AA36H6E7_CYLNA|nr:unnamed protein product [Cylicocyclus nassatus]
MRTILLLITVGLLISASSAASIANLEAKRLFSEEGDSYDRANPRRMENLGKLLINETLSSSEVSDQDNQNPSVSSNVSEDDFQNSPSSSEVTDEDSQTLESLPVTEEERGKRILSAEVFEDLQKSSTSSENPDQEVQSPLALSEPEIDHRQPRSSPIVIEEDRRKLSSSEVSENLQKPLTSPKLSDEEIEIPLASSEVSEKELQRSRSSPEVKEDSQKSISSSEVSKDLRKSPTSPKLSDGEIQVPLASSEVFEENFPPSPEVPKKDLNDEFYQNMAFAMEKAAQEVLRENAGVTSSSEVSEDPRKLPVSSEIPEKDLQKLFDFFRYIASTLTNEEYSSKLKDSYPVWDVISSLLKGTYKACENSQTSTPSEIDNSRKDSLKWWQFIETTKRPSKTVRKESQEDIGDWWKYIPDVKQESPREEPMDDNDLPQAMKAQLAGNVTSELDKYPAWDVIGHSTFLSLTLIYGWNCNNLTFPVLNGTLEIETTTPPPQRR